MDGEHISAKMRITRFDDGKYRTRCDRCIDGVTSIT
jgi:hypothetical protein